MNVIRLILSITWLTATVVVDFLVLPSTFSVVTDFFLAGNLGVTLFNKFNPIEFILGSSLFALHIWYYTQTKRGLWSILISFLLLGIAALYWFSLTPKLTHLTAAWEYAEKMGTIGQGEQDVQALHMTYHQTYIWLDSVKLLLLLALSTLQGLSLFRKSG